MADGNELRKKERLSIYLAKEPVATAADLVKAENVKRNIRLRVSRGAATLFIKKEPVTGPPSWTALFTVLPEVPHDAFGSSKSVGAVLAYQIEGRTFLLSFGHGHHLIKEDVVERDFGLRVTLNSVEPSKLRSLDKASYDHNPLNFRTQSSRELDIFDLEMDAETEMLYAVTGVSKESVFGSHVTGRDALTLVVGADVEKIAGVLSAALKKYREPLSPAFDWVDNISRVRDPDLVDQLDLHLNDALADGSGSIWLGEPEIVDWERQIGYSFDLRPNTPCHVVLDLDDLEDHLQKKGRDLTVDALKAQDIHIKDKEHQSFKCWSAYRCLYAEIAVDTKQYVLRNGTWYRVSSDFVITIDRALAAIPICGLPFPRYNHDSEGAYNTHVAVTDPTFALMDKKNIQIGGALDKIEFCDLIKDASKLVHVKYYRSSSTLSHLFAQGRVASEAFVRDEDFRTKLNPKLPKAAKLKNPKIRPDAGAYTIVYAIATTKTLPDQLPFFSKVTLKNAWQTLRALNFNVELAAIPVDPVLSRTTKLKPKVKK